MPTNSSTLLEQTTLFEQGRNCPGCGKHLNAATPYSGGDGEEVKPRAGDLTICAYCTAFLKYEGDALDLVLLTFTEIGELPSDIRSALVRARIYFVANKIGVLQ